MGQFSMEISGHAGSVLSGNQHPQRKPRGVRLLSPLSQGRQKFTHLVKKVKPDMKSGFKLSAFQGRRPPSSAARWPAAKEVVHLGKKSKGPRIPPEPFSPKRIGYLW